MKGIISISTITTAASIPHPQDILACIVGAADDVAHKQRRVGLLLLPNFFLVKFDMFRKKIYPKSKRKPGKAINRSLPPRFSQLIPTQPILWRVFSKGITHFYLLQSEGCI